MAWIDGLLKKMIEDGASDLHLSTGEHPIFRQSGEMEVVAGSKPATAEEQMSHLEQIAPEKDWAQFVTEWDADFAYALEGYGRFRVNLFMDHKGPGAVLRQIPHQIPTASDLGLPPAILEMCRHSKGLVLVTGPTGSGKSTTLAAMIDHINDSRREHILTIEDPIEFVHPNKKCLVNQREIKRHTTSFKRALRAALREDPDIVLVGEMRDLETIAIAIETAETGHLVFGTLHTTTAASTVNRIIDQFPGDQQGQIRMMLASSLKGVVAQTLCKKIGGGRVAAQEILVVNNPVSAMIREGKTHQITSSMQTGAKDGMRLLNDVLLEHVQKGLITPLEGYMKCVSKDDMRSKLEGAGHDVDAPDDSAPAKAPSGDTVRTAMKPAAETRQAPPVSPPPAADSDAGSEETPGGSDDPFEAFRRKRAGQS